MTPVTIDQLEVIQGKTLRETTIGDVTLNVWVNRNGKSMKDPAFIATACRAGFVQNLTLPYEITHLDRAFEHAVQEVMEDIARREAARAIVQAHVEGEPALCYFCLKRDCVCSDDAYDEWKQGGSFS